MISNDTHKSGKFKAGLEYVVDLYRTAPFGETGFLINEGFIPLNYDNPILLIMNILGSLGGIGLSIKQFRLRKRLEKSVSDHGYADRAFETTLTEWCDRQTARVVAKNYNCLDNYDALCNSNKDRMFLANLGHI